MGSLNERNVDAPFFVYALVYAPVLAHCHYVNCAKRESITKKRMKRNLQ